MKKLAMIFLLLMMMAYPSISQTVIRIVGDVDAKMVKSQVYQSLDYLGIQEPVYMHIIFTDKMPKPLRGMTCFLPFSDSTRVFRIRMDIRLNEAQRLNVLAHEMMHVGQYLSGDLKIVDGNTIWKGDRYPYNPRDPRKLPWEAEAYRYDQYLAKVLRDIPRERLLASEIEK